MNAIFKLAETYPYMNRKLLVQVVEGNFKSKYCQMEKSHRKANYALNHTIILLIYAQ